MTVEVIISQDHLWDDASSTLATFTALTTKVTITSTTSMTCLFSHNSSICVVFHSECDECNNSNVWFDLEKLTNTTRLITQLIEKKFWLYSNNFKAKLKTLTKRLAIFIVCLFCIRFEFNFECDEIFNKLRSFIPGTDTEQWFENQIVFIYVYHQSDFPKLYFDHSPRKLST